MRVTKPSPGLASVATSGSAQDLVDGTTKKVFLSTERTRLAALPDLDSSGHLPSSVMRQTTQHLIALRRAGAIAETLSRTNGLASVTAPSSGTLYLFALYLLKGTTVTSVTFASGSTAGASLTHTWFSLYDSSLAPVGLTADDTSASWTAASEKTLALTAPYAVPNDGLYYVGIVVTGTTMPTLAGVALLSSGPGNLAPSISGRAGSVGAYATGPGSAPSPAPSPFSAYAGYAWAYVS